MNDKQYWIPQKLFEYEDTKTASKFELSLNSAVFESDYGTTFREAKITFAIRDKRIGKGSPIRIDLDYCDLFRLIQQLDNILKVSSEKTVYETGGQIIIPKFLYKKKKELIISFFTNQGNKTSIDVVDPTSKSGSDRSTVTMNGAFIALRVILNQIKDSYVSISTGMINITQQERMIKTMEDSLKVVNESILKSNNVRFGPISETPVVYEPTLEDIPIDELPPLTNESPPFIKSLINETLVDNFDKTLKDTNGFDSKEVNTENLNYIVKEEKEESPKVFLNDFLNWDLNNLNNWATSIISSTEKTNAVQFAPFDMVIQLGKIDNVITKNNNYYKSQYAIVKTIKDIVKNSLGNNLPQINIPPVRFIENIDRNCELYELSKEITLSLILFSMFVRRLDSIEIKKSDESKLDEYKRTSIVLRSVFSPFIFSINNIEEFKNDIITEYNSSVVNSSMLENIKNLYTTLSMGGSFEVTQKSVEDNIINFLILVKNNKPFNIGIDSDVLNFMKSINAETNEVLNNAEDIKSLLTNSNENKLTVFLKCASKYMKVDDIKNRCKSYKDLSTYFKSNNVLNDVLKIKRVMDLDPTLEKKEEIFRMVKILNEDDDVTEARATNDIVNEDHYNFNVEDMVGDF